MTTIIRVDRVLIGSSPTTYYTWVDNFILSYEPVNIWVDIDVPYGAIIHQPIKSPHVHGILYCRDYDDMITALYGTAIDSNNNKAIMNISGVGARPFLTGFFMCQVVGADNTVRLCQFVNWSVENLNLERIEFEKDTYYPIHWHCDYVVYQ